MPVMPAEPESKRLHALAAAEPERVEARARALLALGHDPAWARLALGAVGVARADLTLAMVELVEALSLFRDAGDTEGELAALVLLVNAWVMAGDRPQARLTAGRALRLARRLGARATEARLLVNLAYTHGEDDDAVSYEMLTQQALTIFESLGDAQAVSHCLVNMAGAQIRSGQWAEAGACYDRAERLCRERQWGYIEALIWAGRGGLALAQGAADEALALYAESNRRLEAQGRHYQRIRQDFLVGESLVRLAEVDLARQRLRIAVQEAAAAGYGGLVAQAHHALAQASNLEGDHADAAEHEALATSARAALGTDGPSPQAASALQHARAVLATLDHRPASP